MGIILNGAGGNTQSVVEWIVRSDWLETERFGRQLECQKMYRIVMSLSATEHGTALVAICDGPDSVGEIVRSVREMARKLGRTKFGPYRLLSVKDPGGSWEGVGWFKAKSKAQISEMDNDEYDKSVISRCPYDVPGMCFPADGYPLVRSECKGIPADHELCDEDRNCVFLFRYANTLNYNCRLLDRTDKERVYEEEW